MKLLIALPGRHDNHLTLEHNPSDTVLMIKKSIQKHFEDLELANDKVKQSNELDANHPESHLDIPDTHNYLPQSHFHLPESHTLIPEQDASTKKDPTPKPEVKPKKTKNIDKKKTIPELKLNQQYNVEIQTLVYRRAKLKNEDKIEDCGINEGAVINLYINRLNDKVQYFSCKLN